ncbi:CitB Response regulator containing a CheY-like receiver domain and an HTH DNA-binding domain [Candidatus Nanopelagicaceae bacterium]|mgnify:FL=1
MLLVEDEDFTRTMVSEMLSASGINVLPVASVAEALKLMDEFDPHVVLTDLDLGHGPDGADLLTKVAEDRPWTGMVIMTAHASPELAINDVSRIPEQAGYIVKSELNSIHSLVSIIQESIIMPGNFNGSDNVGEEKVTITSSQAEILRMIADGLSNTAIAEARGITLRAAEALIQRTFAALGVNGDSSINARVAAVRMWQQGKVAVK